jgi:hypothetical protein
MLGLLLRAIESGRNGFCISKQERTELKQRQDLNLNVKLHIPTLKPSKHYIMHSKIGAFYLVERRERITRNRNKKAGDCFNKLLSFSQNGPLLRFAATSKREWASEARSSATRPNVQLIFSETALNTQLCRTTTLKPKSLKHASGFQRSDYPHS